MKLYMVAYIFLTYIFIKFNSHTLFSSTSPIFCALLFSFTLLSPPHLVLLSFPFLSFLLLPFPFLPFLFLSSPHITPLSCFSSDPMVKRNCYIYFSILLKYSIDVLVLSFSACLLLTRLMVRVRGTCCNNKILPLH